MSTTETPGNASIDGMSALHCGDYVAGTVLTGRGAARCRAALSGIQAITTILFQLELDKECTGGIQATPITTTGLIHALAVCADFVSDHIDGGGSAQFNAQSINCDSPDYLDLQALHSRARKGAAS